MLDLLRSKFELEGFEVQTAESGDEGIDLAQSDAPDLIVLDERLQDGAGVPIAERLKELDGLAEVPVILLTSRDSEAGETGKPGNGASVQLPFRPSQLLALVRETL